MAKQNKRETYPVIFRRAGSKPQGFEILAIFPYAMANPGALVCYAHLGQHSECDLRYYQDSKRANPEQYEDLLAELRSIYETEPDAVTLVVKQRLPRNWRDHAWKRS